jgi:hypothetical protein
MDRSFLNLLRTLYEQQQASYGIINTYYPGTFSWNLIIGCVIKHPILAYPALAPPLPGLHGSETAPPE